jgi:hypothetical protein
VKDDETGPLLPRDARLSRPYHALACHWWTATAPTRESRVLRRLTRATFDPPASKAEDHRSNSRWANLALSHQFSLVRYRRRRVTVAQVVADLPSKGYSEFASCLGAAVNDYGTGCVHTQRNFRLCTPLFTCAYTLSLLHAQLTRGSMAGMPYKARRPPT